MHGRAVRRVLFSPDGSRVASAGQAQGRHEVVIWDRAAGTKLLTLPHGTSYLSDIAFSPDGRHLLTIASNQLRVWDLAQGDEVPAFAMSDVRLATFGSFVLGLRMNPFGSVRVPFDLQVFVQLLDADGPSLSQ